MTGPAKPTETFRYRAAPVAQTLFQNVDNLEPNSNNDYDNYVLIFERLRQAAAQQYSTTFPEAEFESCDIGRPPTDSVKLSVLRGERTAHI